MGVYISSFIIRDFVGNELVISGNELDLLGGSSTTTFINTNENVDTEPPYYIIHPEYGPNLFIFGMNDEVQVNGVANLYIGFRYEDWIYNELDFLESLGLDPHNVLFDDGSGIDKFGLRMTSPSGTISEVYIEPIWDFSYNVTGSWFEICELCIR